jgi:outer membrane biogenesis lipoprotein LolB
LALLQQDGWSIRFTKYQKVGNQQLPAKIIIARDDLRFLLIIYKWDTDVALAKL